LHAEVVFHRWKDGELKRLRGDEAVILLLLRKRLRALSERLRFRGVVRREVRRQAKASLRHVLKIAGVQCPTSGWTRPR
jgi:hypothetical protein